MPFDSKGIVGLFKAVVQIMIQELSKNEIQTLPADELAIRMDFLLDTNVLERYGPQAHKIREEFPGLLNYIQN